MEPLSTYRPRSKTPEVEAYHRAVRYIASKAGWTIPEVEHVLFMFSEYISDSVMEGRLIEFPHLGVFCAYPHKRRRRNSPVADSAFIAYRPHPILRRAVWTAKHTPPELLNRARDYSYPRPGGKTVQRRIEKGEANPSALPSITKDRSGRDKTVGANIHRIREKLHARYLRANS